MRSTRVFAALAALLVPLSVSAAPAAPVATAAPVEAAGVTVTVKDMAFTPVRVTVALGSSVTWSFQDAMGHSATSNSGFFDTGVASGGATRSVRFRSAGTFGYHCSVHPLTMTGTVVVPMTAAGTESNGWTVRWRTGKNPAGRTYDVQVRRVGTKPWTAFRRGTTAASGRFDPQSGHWQARARTVKGTARSGWSPALTLPTG